jgi:methanogenic corrinoid protein MtbC1
MVPRIMLRRGELGSRPAPVDALPARLAPAEINEFAALVLQADPLPATTFIDHLRQRGMPLEMVYLDLLSPAARHLGDRWIADTLSFSEVTLGLWRMHHLLRDLSEAFHSEGDRVPAGFQALLLPVPGEQHTFGLLMVAEFFRQSGWAVSSGPFSSSGELARIARGGWYAVVGFSVSREDQLDSVAAETAPCGAPPAIVGGVMVGGRVVVEPPELVRRGGADATATDGREAVHQAQNLVTLKSNY